MRHLIAFACIAAFAALCGLDARGQDKKKEEPKLDKVAPCCPAGHTFKHLDSRPIVFIANGSGGSTVLGDNLLDLNGEFQLGLRLHVVPWCR